MRTLPVILLLAATPVGAEAQTPGPAPAPAQQAAEVPPRLPTAVLLQLCERERLPCLTYILGVVDSFAATLAIAGRPQAFCVPAATTNDQLADAAIDRLRNKGTSVGSNAAVEVAAALIESFPCG